ncbi:MAG TPA: SDR family oxidoreductase [Gammaproteobacteria bacterium]|nr:SDR family oxidoreductase [Gammaproteobacteria bacterium]
MKIVVIGGTGLIGSKVVEKLKQRGHDAVAAAPSTGVDTMTGKGLDEALTGARVVVDVSNSPSFEDQAAMDFFSTSGRNVGAAERKAGVRHHVALSVVGTDRMQDSGYFRAKLAQEQMIEASGIPYTLIHATQFFEFIRSIADASTEGGAVRLPPVKFQPIAAEDVASAIAEAAAAEPENGTIEIAGPESFTLDRAVREVLEYDHDARTVTADPAAPYYGTRVSEDTLVPGAGARLAGTTLEWWLGHVPAPAKAARRAPAAKGAH